MDARAAPRTRPIVAPHAAALARIPVERRTASVAGADTVWWQYGPRDARVSVLLVHGFRGDHHGLEPVVAQLPGWRFVSPDLPGFGESGRLPVPHTLDAFVAWLREFASVAALTDTVVLGHSFGSIVASAAVADGLPARALVLLNPIAAPALEGPRGVLTRLAVLYYRAGAALPHRAGNWLLRQRAIVRAMSVTMAKTRDRGLRRWIHEEHDRYFSGFADRSSLLDAFRTSVSHDVSDRAGQIRQPTLLVAAERDDITTVAAQRRLVELFADAELVVIPDVGHLIHYETPDAAADAIESFLSRRLGTPPGCAVDGGAQARTSGGNPGGASPA